MAQRVRRRVRQTSFKKYDARLILSVGLLAAIVLISVALSAKPFGQDAPFDQSKAQANSDQLRDTGGEVKINQVSIIGDSYTVGTADTGQVAAVGQEGFDPNTSWPNLARAGLGRQGVRISEAVDGAGGSGYATRGPTGYNFGDVIPRIVDRNTNLVVIFGSRNDAGAPNIKSEIESTLTQVRSLAPEAQIMVIGPPWTSEAVPSEIASLRDTVRDAATSANAIWVDPLQERWFFGPDQRFIGVDKIHPNAAGQAYLAGKISPHLAAALR